MIAVVQRVNQARVDVEGKLVGQVGHGMAVLVAVEKEDTAADVQWMASKLVNLRIFRGGDKHFECDVQQCGGGILLVSNFTVAAETKKGRRPSLEGAAPPEKGKLLFDQLVEAVKQLAPAVPLATGRFGADMQVSLTNDGPVTFLLRSR